MRQKVLLCVLVILVLSIVIVPNLHNKLRLQSPLQSIEIHSDANSLVLIPNFRTILHDFLKLGANHIFYPSIIKKQLGFVWFDCKNQIIVLFLCRFILLFFIFYQLARNNSKQDDPVLING